jgi:hypothetical protein
VLLPTPLGPPVAPARACWSARAAGSPEPVPLRPPPDSRRRAPLPARLPSQPTISAHPLDPSEAARATHWPAPSLSSPEFEHPRPRHHWSATAARRQHLGSILRHPSITGEPNRRFPSLVCLPRLTSPPESSSSPSVPGRGRQGHKCEDLKTSRRFPVKRFFTLDVFWLWLVKSIKNCRKIQK